MATSKDHASNNSSDDLFSPAYSKRRRILSDSEASSSSSDQITGFLPRRNRIESDSEDEPESDDNQDQEINWRIPQGKQANISFSGSSGISSACDPEVFSYTEPHSFYFLFATEEVFEIIAVQMNIYAAQIKSEQQSNRLDKWSETNPNEIKRFFGLIIWMGLVRLPQIHLYWSTDEGYNQTFPRTVMSRNRFELLLRFVHFSNNEENDPNNRLCKIIEIMDILNSNFKKYYNPEEVLCVDESLVPFRGRIKFRQYSTQKRHRYGMKIFKLCGGAGYTYSFQVYTGKEENTSQVSGYKSSAVVMSLCEEILGKGHTICTDNWYTSVELAE